MLPKFILYISFLLFIYPLLTFAQIKDDVVIVSYDLLVPGIGGTSQNSKHEFVVKGTPYLNSAFKTGNIIIGKNRMNIQQALLRFNAYRNHFEINQNGKKAFVVQSQDVRVQLADKTYHYVGYIENGKSKTGYFTPIHTGRTLLYERTVKIVPPTAFPENGYDTFERPEFRSKTTYFIKRKNKAAEKLRHLSRKEVFSRLWDKYSELRRYARKNKLNVRNIEDTIKILDYYDKLQLNSEGVEQEK